MMIRTIVVMVVAVGACHLDLDAGRVIGADSGDPGFDGATSGIDTPPAPPPSVDASAGSYFPMAVGCSWAYRVSGTRDSSRFTFTKVQAVESFDIVGGSRAHTDRRAFVLRTTKRGGDDFLFDQTISWQGWEGDALVRYRELAFRPGTTEVKQEEIWIPSRLRIDTSLRSTTMAARFSETYTEVKIPAGELPTDNIRTELWEVRAVDEEVTVPRGRFSCLHLVNTSNDGASAKHYWFARGVGKVKEVGAQTEELLDFVVQSPAEKP